MSPKSTFAVPMLLLCALAAGCRNPGPDTPPPAPQAAAAGPAAPAGDAAPPAAGPADADAEPTPAGNDAAPAADAPEAAATDPENAAIARLRQALADGRYDGRIQADCLSYIVETATPDQVDIAVHEKHGGACPGDPATSPVLDRYRVTGDAILKYDPAEGDYVADGKPAA